jgi:putative DNA primase/helicase
MAMLDMANSEPGIPVTHKDLDSDIWLLNCSNGTLNLQTGELITPHRRSDLITKITPVEYQHGAKYELWDEFLTTATDGNEELIAFLQRAVGYSLTGSTQEEKLFFIHGPAATGKSTFVEAIKSMMGDYASTADFESFLQRRDVGSARNDIAALAGARLVTSIEVDEGKRLAEGLIKLITGGDTLRARFLYRESFEFLPELKLWLCANHAPEVSGSDTAMWRRILKLPFDHEIPEADRDPQVKTELKNSEAAKKAVLAWAVEGCLRWQEYGLMVPGVVKDATEKYRAEMNVIEAFIGDCCVIDRNVFVLKGDLYEAYTDWCGRSGEDTYKMITFGRELKSSKHRINDGIAAGNTKIWQGIGLLSQINKTE